MVMDQSDILKSEILAKGEHAEEIDGCDHCCFGAAMKDNDRYEILHKSVMANLLDENPWASFVVEPVSQAIFNMFLLGVIMSKSATIAAVEKGELDIWTQKDQSKLAAKTEK